MDTFLLLLNYNPRKLIGLSGKNQKNLSLVFLWNWINYRWKKNSCTNDSAWNVPFGKNYFVGILLTPDEQSNDVQMQWIFCKFPKTGIFQLIEHSWILMFNTFVFLERRNTELRQNTEKWQTLRERETVFRLF